MSHNQSVTVTTGTNKDTACFEISAIIIPTSDGISDQNCLVSTSCCFHLSSPAMKIHTEFLFLLSYWSHSDRDMYLRSQHMGLVHWWDLRWFPGWFSLGSPGRATQQLLSLTRQISNSVENPSPVVKNQAGFSWHILQAGSNELCKHIIRGNN